MVLLSELPPGFTAEAYAAELFTRWNIGRDTGGRGVLFLFVESAGELKIEVGYELEGVYPDAFVGSFQDSLRHYFAGRYFGDVVSSMITAMLKRAQQHDPESLVAEFKNSLPGKNGVEVTYKSGGGGILESGFLYEKDQKLKLIRELGEEIRSTYTAHSDPHEVVRRYIDSLSKGYNDPYLGLLTEGSRYMRLEYPKSAGYQRQAAREFGGKYDLKTHGDLAVATFGNPNAIPLLLRKDQQGLWHIDVPKSWAYIQASSDLKSMRPAYGDHPWMFAWPKDLWQDESPPTPELYPMDVSIAAEIASLESAIEKNPDTASNYFRLADILFFECYWIRAAMDTLERGLEKEPGNVAYRKRLIQFSYRFPDLSKVQQHYEAILKHDPNDRSAIKGYIWFLKNYRNEPQRVATLEQRLAESSSTTKYPIPTEPYDLKADAATKHTRWYDIPEGANNLEVEVSDFREDWHEKWYPAIRIFVSDSHAKRWSGIHIQRTTPDGNWEVNELEASGADVKITPVSGMVIPRKQKYLFALRWVRNGKLRIELDGDTVATLPLDFEPAKIKTFVRSGGATFHIQTNAP